MQQLIMKTVEVQHKLVLPVLNSELVDEKGDIAFMMEKLQPPVEKGVRPEL
jgi:hypothetical protein